MSWTFRILWLFMRQYLRGRMIDRAKRQGLVAYIKALQGARHALIVALLIFFVFQIVVVAGFGALVTGLLISGIELSTALKILCAIFSTLFVLPVVALAIVFNERVWYRASGAKKMVEELNETKFAA